ncbi:MAG: tRNA pseudouridine(55) synthase TruB [Burkholderiales bacterium]|nr:tRNA pseudouridine(55) synthase TruB [Burkholderiales bacterium]
MPGPRQRSVDGVLLLDKPAGPSSSAVLQAVKRLLEANKAGHAGTLDPMATGLLPLLFGEATKFARYGLDAAKEYVADVRLGTSTDTGDAQGEVTGRKPVAVSADLLEAALARFRGELAQVPPMYSALKRAGQPLYALARAGKTVERAPRRIVVHELELLARDGELLRLRIRCSKGTYIRQLAEDLGLALGTLAHLQALRRTAVGSLRVDEAIALEDLQALGDSSRLRWLLPPDRLIEHLPRVDLDEALAARFLQGQAVRPQAAPQGPSRVYRAGILLGVGEGGPAGLRPARLIARA